MVGDVVEKSLRKMKDMYQREVAVALVFLDDVPERPSDREGRDGRDLNRGRVFAMERKSHEISMAAAALRGSGAGRFWFATALDCDIREEWICQPRASKVEGNGGCGDGGFRLARGAVNNRDLGDAMVWNWGLCLN